MKQADMLPGEVSKADFTGQGNLKPNADILKN
jgi:hypothetical protein